MSRINFGGNEFFTNKAEAIKAANRYATATVYGFKGAITEDGDGILVTGIATVQNLYLLMPLGYGASDENLRVVQWAMDGAVVYSREDWRPLN